LNTPDIPPSDKDFNGRVIIRTRNASISSLADQGIQALKLRNDPIRLIEYAGHLSRYCNGRIERLTQDALRGELDRAASYSPEGSGSYGDARRFPPLEVVRDILASPSPGFPIARGILRYPILSPDGAIRTDAGLDEQTGWIYDPFPSDFRLPAIPLHQTRTDLKQAIDEIHEVISEFPFDGPASYASVVAAMVTLAARPALSGCIPMFAADAPTVGEGKGLMVRSIVASFMGEDQAVSTMCGDDAEWGKTLVGILKAGSGILFVDNITEPVESATLAAFLTSRRFRGRLLGTNDVPEFENNCLLFAAGNNLQFSPDIARRVYVSRLDSKSFRASDREGTYKHDPLIEYVLARRPYILAAVFTLIRGWFDAGSPAPKVRPLPSFEEWSRFVGGVLEHAGVEGFLGNVVTVQDRGSQELEYYAGIVTVIYNFAGNQELTAAEIVLHEDGPNWEQILPKRVHADTSHEIARELGKMFAKFRGGR
jgi:putative DNA primase/helicase